jgi:DNA-directed RNA polymerase subunit K/omega
MDDYLDDRYDDNLNDYIGGEEEEEDEIVVPESETIIKTADPDGIEDEEEQVEEEEEEDLPRVEDKDDFEVNTSTAYNKEVIIIAPDKRKFSNILSKYEMTEIISIRSTQIAHFNNCMVDAPGLSDPILMAKRELMMRKCPLVLSRFAGELPDQNGKKYSYYEYWYPNEMQFAVMYPDVI